jgi:hypothetical protein
MIVHNTVVQCIYFFYTKNVKITNQYQFCKRANCKGNFLTRIIKRHTNPAHPITLKHFAPSYNFIFCLPEQGQGPIVVVSSILQISLNQLPFL